MALHLKSTGIDFVDFGDATESNELLDDYEEGSFTPAWSGGSFAQNHSYYVKSGAIVHIQAWLYSSGVTPANSLTGLPFTSASVTSNAIGGGPLVWHNGGGHNVTWSVGAGGSAFYMRQHDNDHTMATGKSYYITGSYSTQT
jgi:hypothetical protein